MLCKNENLVFSWFPGYFFFGSAYELGPLSMMCRPWAVKVIKGDILSTVVRLFWRKNHLVTF